MVGSGEQIHMKRWVRVAATAVVGAAITLGATAQPKASAQGKVSVADFSLLHETQRPVRRAARAWLSHQIAGGDAVSHRVGMVEEASRTL